MKSKEMLELSMLYLYMLNRVEPALNFGYVDKYNHIFIFCPYDDIINDFNWGKTKVWKMYKLLKEKGLITVKHIGLGFPMIIFPYYIHSNAMRTELTRKRKIKLIRNILKMLAPSEDDAETRKKVLSLYLQHHI